MPLSWNEIRSRAISFSNEWRESYREEADAQSFLIEFLNVFGISRKRVATFERKVKKVDASSGYIDLLWPGQLLVEMKSRGENLEKAYRQARDYCHGLTDHEVPKQIIICDFELFNVYDENGVLTQFTLSKLVDNIQLFADIAGYQKRTYKEQDPVNIEAAELMGQLHDKLKEIGYQGHDLEVYLVRLLFILFADDTNIFEKGIFHDYLEDRTVPDGSDLALHLEALFSVLNTPEDRRLKNLDEQLNRFPYVNGKLFEERLPLASFDSTMRSMLITCCSLNWGKISPAIFGSLFQSVMDAKARRNLGAHYTSEKNIMKVIEPLFLDDLKTELRAAGNTRSKLLNLHGKLSKLKFLDPACGCGNFLIIAYRELRLLELEVVKLLLKGQTVTNISHYFLVDVDQFYGIEYEEFPSQVAQVAMWLIDHQMSMLASETFGEYMPRIPLRKSAVIVHGNALRIDWQSLIDSTSVGTNLQTFDFIIGNPPFAGTAYQTEEQKDDMKITFVTTQSYGMLDYVAAWYLKAARYLQLASPQKAPTKVCFVSTSSIIQGEQPGILWRELFETYGIKILFAHQTFKWTNESRGNAGVHVVIIGFAKVDMQPKHIFIYSSVTGTPMATVVKNINAYLVEGSDTCLRSIPAPICSVPQMISGSAARDGGHLILSDDERVVLIGKYPEIERYLRRFISGDDIINNVTRWCIWLKDAPPQDFRDNPELKKRFSMVRDFREKSTRAGTRKMSTLPYLFAEERQPQQDFLIIPKVSSENRHYIPIAYLTKDHIISDKTFVVPNATIFQFGVLTSSMHMTWMRFTCGRLESRYSYSNTIVYNNFPWPEDPSKRVIQTVEKAAERVLFTRSQYEGSSLADLYDPNSMPLDLLKAHEQLDKAVDLCYRSHPFVNDTKRIEFLFDLYDVYCARLKENNTTRQPDRQNLL